MLLTKQEFFPLFWVDNENSLEMIFVLSCVESVLSCLEGNTSKLSQRLRISCIDALLVSDPSMLSSFVLSSGKRLVFALPPPSSLLFLQQDKKGEKEDHFPFQSTFCHTENKLMPR